MFKSLVAAHSYHHLCHLYFVSTCRVLQQKQFKRNRTGSSSHGTTEKKHSQTRPSLPYSTICELVSRNNGDELIQSLEKCPVQWSPDLVNGILKRVWNDGPKALLFFNWVSRQRSFKQNLETLDYMIDILGRMRDYKTLWRLLSQMRKKGILPTERTFAIVIERYVSSGKAERAIRVFLSMHHHGCPQNLSSFNTLLDILCKSKRVEMAQAFFQVFKRKFTPDVITYNILANGWCLVKKTPKALEILKEMVNDGLTPSLTTYNTLLQGFFTTGQLKEAWDFFLQMKRRKCVPDVVTYTTIVHGFGVMGEVEKAQRVFEDMIREGCLPSVATYNAMIQILCKKESVMSAFRVFDEMVDKGYTPNITTYNVLIKGLCHAGEMDRSLEFITRMKEDGCDPNIQTYNIVIRYFCDAGEIEKAFDVFIKMEAVDCVANLDTYNILLSAMCVTKKPDDLVAAGKLLLEMVEKGHVPRRLTFNRLVNGLLLTGNQGFAKELLRVQSQCGLLPRKIRL